jgi:uncharacterized DUF497 family protein
VQSDKYEWDDRKAAVNLEKHGVSFEEAITVFEDARLMLRLDEEHSTEDEERWHAIGFTNKARLVVTVIVDRDGRVRVISARKATPAERRFYATQ